MVTERQIAETIARCVAEMVFFYNSEKTSGTRAQMVAGVRTVAGRVSGWGLSDARILRPVADELLVRYGPEAGGRLYAEFANAYRSRT
jgi:hypothetical protein